MKFLSELLLYLLFEKLAFRTGQFFVPLLSFGRVRPGEPAEMRGRQIARRDDGTRVLDTNLVQVAGILVWVVAGVAICLAYRWT